MKTEIVAAYLKSGHITNDRLVIAAAVKTNQIDDWLDKRRVQFMASFDLGQHWTALANSPTLFVLEIDANGNWIGIHPSPEAE